MVIKLSIPHLSSNDNSTVTYLPHGVSTLTIEVKNGDDANHRLIVRPTNRSDPPDFVAYESGKNGLSTNSKALKILWGGGESEGFQLDLAPKKASKIFFLIIHDSEEIDNYSFDLQAMEVTEASVEKKILTNMRINLIPPAQLTNYSKIVRMIVTNDTTYSRTVEFRGNLVTSYKSRWFCRSVDYSFLDLEYPDFVLSYNMNGQYTSGKITVSIRTNGQIYSIATIEGDIERSKVHIDLFHFVDDYYVLRIWLYWINDFFEGNRIIGGRGTGGKRSSVMLNSQSVSSSRTRDTTELKAWKQKVIEVPDAERFDLVFHKKTSKIEYVCTDLHWQELWWSVNANFVRLGFAGLDTVPRLILNLPLLLDRSFGNRPKDIDPALKVAKELKNGNKKVIGKEIVEDNPLTITEKAPKDKVAENTTLGHGIHRKHVPYMFGHSLMPAFVSNDVRICE